MNKYELCFHAWHGELGKRKHFLTTYCKEGFRTDSKTDARLSNKRCVDWYGSWNGGCSDLKPRKSSGAWVKEKEVDIDEDLETCSCLPLHNHIFGLHNAYLTAL